MTRGRSDQRDETEARLADLGAAFTYVYEFGDDWFKRPISMRFCFAGSGPS